MEQQLRDFAIAEALARTARATPGIADVYGGRWGEIATYGRRARVRGVRLDRAAQLRVEVHVVAAYSRDLALPSLAQQLRERLGQQLRELDVAPDGGIDIVIDDLRIGAALPATGSKQDESA